MFDWLHDIMSAKARIEMCQRRQAFRIWAWHQRFPDFKAPGEQ